MGNRAFIAPEYDKTNENAFKVFLAGTIDNGNSLDWQKEIANEILSKDTEKPIFIYNPRRINWPDGDSHDEITIQIKWELNHLENADLIIMNILPNSKSPISLMEIGLFARQNKLVVFCNPAFYRYDNVRVVCEEYGIPLFNTNDILVIRNEILKRSVAQ